MELGKTEKKLLHGGRTFTVCFVDRISDLESIWPSRDSGQNTLMSYEYLLTIEQAPPKRIEFLYSIVFDEHKEVVAFLYFQYKPFNAGESLNYTIENTWSQKITNSIKHFVASRITSYGLVCGNLLITGDHGSIWTDEKIMFEERRQLLAKVQYLAFEHSNEQGRKIGFILSKDHLEPAAEQDLIDWNSVNVQPNMILHFDDDWSTMDDYLGAMRSKYRKRINSALRKVSDFEFEEVGVEEIEANKKKIYELYLEIVDRAPFNMFMLSPDYFPGLKQNLGDNCDFTLVYKGERLVAFQINLENNGDYEAHFLGYDHDLLKSHDIYLNLLLHTVKLALKRKKSDVVFSRTAMQIKSSIGAVPEQLYLYLALRNKFLNRLVKLAFKYLNPPVVFNQRHPFK